MTTQELLRAAVRALWVNNGAARRAIYGQARASLADQLRGCDPPVGSNEEVRRWLHLEDAIRQVEREQNEAPTR